MRGSFEKLDMVISEKNDELNENSLNSNRVKAVFYALHFGRETLDFDDDYNINFVNCFINSSSVLENMGTVYSNMTDFLGRIISADEKANAENIYNHLLYGDNIVDDSYSFSGYWSSGLIDTDIQYIGGGAETHIVYFNQADSRWGSESYGYSGTDTSG